MMKKIFPLFIMIVTGTILTGMLAIDPYESKTKVSNSDAVNPPVSYSDEVKFSDDMNGLNDTAGLRTRGWIPKRGPLSGPAGTTPNWFQGNSTVFNAFEGPATGYVAANFNNVTGANTIDLWLISPSVNGAPGDTISFYSRAPDGSTFPDSIRVYWASNGDTVPGSGSFVELGKFKVSTAGWVESRYVLPSAGATGRFAINYRVVNGGPSGLNSDFIGVDLVRLVGPLTAIDPVSSTVPDKYSLEQNYPNPFNPSTNIRFSIPASGMVKMNVFDALGRKVETLVNETMNAGTYEVSFNASKLSSGIYFYTIETGNFTATKKMLLVK